MCYPNKAVARAEGACRRMSASYSDSTVYGGSQLRDIDVDGMFTCNQSVNADRDR